MTPRHSSARPATRPRKPGGGSRFGRGSLRRETWACSVDKGTSGGWGGGGSFEAPNNVRELGEIISSMLCTTNLELELCACAGHTQA